MHTSPRFAAQDIAVPASISNVGPGFDALGVAIDLFLRVRVVDVRPEAPDTLECDFITAAPAGENRILAAYRHARAILGRPAPGLRVQVRSDIPSRAGLGSSGAATVAGLLLYASVTEPRPREEWLRLATAIEGHPDNAAAALFGGLTICCQHEDGRVTARASTFSEAIRLVVATPEVEIATSGARQVLPAAVSLRDAVFNLQHALLVVHALRSGDIEALGLALRDRWHQPARTPLVPGLREALALRHPSLAGVCLSGSGPSLAAFTTRGREPEVVDLLTGMYARLGIAAEVRPVQALQPAAPAEAPSAAAQT
jgi:homoserine kinase